MHFYSVHAGEKKREVCKLSRLFAHEVKSRTSLEPSDLENKAINNRVPIAYSLVGGVRLPGLR